MVNMTDPSPDLGETRAPRRAAPVPAEISFAAGAELWPSTARCWSKSAMALLVSSPATWSLPRRLCLHANDACLCRTSKVPSALLDSSGWVAGADGIREKDGVRLSVLYQTSTNAVRQDFQALIKQWWGEIGVETELRNIDASVFFGSRPRFARHVPEVLCRHRDVHQQLRRHRPRGLYGQLVAVIRRRGRKPSGRATTCPASVRRHMTRCSPRCRQTGHIGERARLAKAMNDMLMQEYVIIPLVHRGRNAAHANTLGGVIMNVWDSELWNAADWHRVAM